MPLAGVTVGRKGRAGDTVGKNTLWVVNATITGEDRGVVRRVGLGVGVGAGVAVGRGGRGDAALVVAANTAGSSLDASASATSVRLFSLAD